MQNIHAIFGTVGVLLLVTSAQKLTHKFVAFLWDHPLVNDVECRTIKSSISFQQKLKEFPLPFQHTSQPNFNFPHNPLHPCP